MTGTSGEGGSGEEGDTVEVVRSGGFAGTKRTGRMTLGDDPRTPQVRTLLDRIDLAAVPPHEPKPDRFVYRFKLAGQEVVVGEHDLTPELHQLSKLLLEG